MPSRIGNEHVLYLVKQMLVDDRFVQSWMNFVLVVMVNVDSGYMLKVHEAAPSVLVSRDLWLGHLYLLAMNKKVWGGLPKEDKNAIRRAVKKSYQILGSVMDKSFDTQLAELRKAGANVRILSPAELRRWESVTKYPEIQSAWAEAHKNKGVEGAGSALTQVTLIIDDLMRSAV